MEFIFKIEELITDSGEPGLLSEWGREKSKIKRMDQKEIQENLSSQEEAQKGAQKLGGG